MNFALALYGHANWVCVCMLWRICMIFTMQISFCENQIAISMWVQWQSKPPWDVIIVWHWLHVACCCYCNSLVRCISIIYPSFQLITYFNVPCLNFQSVQLCCLESNVPELMFFGRPKMKNFQKFPHQKKFKRIWIQRIFERHSNQLNSISWQEPKSSGQLNGTKVRSVKQNLVNDWSEPETE